MRIHGGLAQLRRVHFAQALEARDRRLRLRLALVFDFLEQRIALGFVECVEHVLAGVDAEQRRHGDVDMAVGDQRPEVPQEQRT